MRQKHTWAFLSVLLMSAICQAGLKVGDTAPDFTVNTHEGKSFTLAKQKGRWTVLYFYPKADTPGCTTQACAFRDSIRVITYLGADVYGISSDEPNALAQFHKKHSLNFTLLSDSLAKVMNAYGASWRGTIAKRWTFIIDPDLKIRHIETNVDPVKDAEKTAKIIEDFKKPKPPQPQQPSPQSPPPKQ